MIGGYGLGNGGKWILIFGMGGNWIGGGLIIIKGLGMGKCSFIYLKLMLK